MEHEGKIGSAFWALRLGLGATAFLAGADKFTNLLTDWKKYMAPEAREKIPLNNSNFMRAVGVIEMLVGLGVLSPRTRLSSYAASAWLLPLAPTLQPTQHYNIPLRSFTNP